MSIQSTQSIRRYDAIDRIIYIDSLIRMHRYKDIVDNSFDPEYDVENYVREYIPVDISNITQWTYQMVEDQMNEPFFRYSMFDNYSVEIEW